MLGRLAAIPRRAPFAFSVFYGGAKTIAADILVQKCLEGRDSIDQRRSLVFLGFGLFQVGFIQYAIYSKLFPCIFQGAGTFAQQSWSQMMRNRQGWATVCKQVLVDMLVYHPLCYFPVFYCCHEVAKGNTYDPSKTVREALRKYARNAPDDLKMLWKVFVPVSFFQNSVCPIYLRVPFVATAGFFYCCILSTTRGADYKAAADMVKEMKHMSEDEFAQCLGAIRSHYSSKDGVGKQEFAEIMDKLGLADVSNVLFEALDDSEGYHPSHSGVIDPSRLAEGLKKLHGMCAPEERAKFISDHPRFIAEEVPARLRRKISRIKLTDLERCIDAIRSRQSRNTEGIDQEELTHIMDELGIAEASKQLFDALSDSDKNHPCHSGVVDRVKLIESLKMLAGQSSCDENATFESENPRFSVTHFPAGLRRSIKKVYGCEFEQRLAEIRNRYASRAEGIGQEEFSRIMSELGLGVKASDTLFKLLNDSDGIYPRNSGLIDATRLVEGLKLVGGRSSPEERVKFIFDNPRFLPEELPTQLYNSVSELSEKEFDECVARVRGRQWSTKDGVGRQEFDAIMREIGLGEASSVLFEALDCSDGFYAKGSGTVDAARFTEAIKLLSGRCSPEERIKFIAENPRFLLQVFPQRSVVYK